MACSWDYTIGKEGVAWNMGLASCSWDYATLGRQKAAAAWTPHGVDVGIRLGKEGCLNPGPCDRSLAKAELGWTAGGRE